MELSKLPGDLEFHHVDFSLHDTPILQDIDFTLKQGHTLGIMGMTGSGKTTIVNLLERFYDVTDGYICLDGHDIRTLPLRTVRDTSSVVMQDVFLFSDTISENVRLGSRSTMIGMYMLCVNGEFYLRKQDILLILCAFCFAIQILLIDHFSPMVDAVRLSCIEFFITGIGSAIPMFIVDMKHSSAGIMQWSQVLSSQSAWSAILYAGVLSSGVAYTLQVVGQKGLNPTFASMLMSLESVVSVFAGWILLGQKLSLREIAGCCMIFAAIMIAQMPDRKTEMKMEYEDEH